MKTQVFFSLSLVLIQVCKSDVTDKEYALMPPIFELDDYDKCMLLDKEALFCTIVFELQLINSDNPSRIWNIIQNVSSNPRNYRHDILRHGICVPTTCPNISTSGHTENIKFTDDLTKCYDKKYTYEGLRGSITDIKCQTNDGPTIDMYDISVAILLSCYLAFVIVASFYEGTARYKPKQEYNRIMATKFGKFVFAFSIPKNWYRLRSYKNTPDMDALKCVQGIRFYNMLCVIMVHTVMLGMLGPVINTKYPEMVTQKFLNMFLASGAYAVQTFFLMSGMLLTYNFFVVFEDKKEVKISFLFWAFFNRYIRLTPTLAVVIAIDSTWLLHAARGPFWDNIVGYEYRNCRKNGWTNLLYINNYVDPKNMCLQQSWYTAADTQLYILALVLVYVMWRFQNRIKILLGLMLVVSILIPGIVTYVNNYDILVRQYPEPLYGALLKVDEWHALYTASHSNIGGYIFGIICGYLFYKYRRENLVTKKIYVVLWWVLSFGLCISIILISAPMYKPEYVSSKLASALYWAFGKNIFAFGIAIGIFGMTQKIGWFARWFVRWSAIQPLGRLTYSAYLIHVTFARIRAGSVRTPNYLTDYLFFTQVLADIVVGYMAATVLCLTVEMPISALQKWLVPQMNDKLIQGGTTKTLEEPINT